ncbi:nuclear transport factor 2 family protein [Pokkaliibacter plantistimulans]|uniref:nuclear transport factor 2 family protein n=1 Tax=Pokkaliibacter plantistimulans TaxID=1635171 RepID=UPI000D742A15|nr:nuclear transport factor 2 family protein [Pokkaliibacter plantistimulans]
MTGPSDAVTARLLQQGLERYLQVFTRLHLGLQGLDDCLTEQVEFRDPFNHVQGRAAVQRVLQHFIEHVSEPRFVIQHCAWSGSLCFVRWDFSGVVKGLGDWCFPGVSELHFDEQGRVLRHLDHWDAGTHFYSRLPLLGWLNRTLVARLTAVPHPPYKADE